jgi:hypothetical protein
MQIYFKQKIHVAASRVADAIEGAGPYLPDTASTTSCRDLFPFQRFQRSR